MHVSVYINSITSNIYLYFKYIFGVMLFIYHKYINVHMHINLCIYILYINIHHLEQ